MKALVGAFNQEKDLVGAFSVIVQPVVEPMDNFTALNPVPGVQVVPAAAVVVVAHEVTGSWPRVPQRRAGQHPGRGHRVLQQPGAVSEPAVSVVYLLEIGTISNNRPQV